VAQPQFVPTDPNKVPHYESPPRREQSWRASRPGEVVGGGQPHGDRTGSQGPDQGYALNLVDQFVDELNLTDGERRDDVVQGCLGVALKRASIYGRAPVAHDWAAAFTVFGYLCGSPDTELIEARRSLFDQVANQQHYSEARELVDLVHTEVLAMTPEEIDAMAWRSRWTQP
jgi:hypothetical protein